MSDLSRTWSIKLRLLAVLEIFFLLASMVGPTVAAAASPLPSASSSAASSSPDVSAPPSPSSDSGAAQSPAESASATPTESPATTASPSPSPVGTASLIIRFVAGSERATMDASVAADGGVETHAIDPLAIRTVDVPADQETAIRAAYLADPAVAQVENDVVRSAGALPNDPQYGTQWNLPKIGWDVAHDSVTPTRTAIIAILDTGIDASHPDLARRVLAGYSEFTGSNAQTDPNGHGTEMAGIAAASTDNATGIAGVAYGGVSLLPVQVLGSGGTGEDSDIIAGVVWAADHGANVILMAFSNPGYSSALQSAIDYAWSKNVVVVAATGNGGSKVPTYPAGDAHVVGVSATDQNDTLATSSNYGPDTFLTAPGVGIPATEIGATYGAVSGTSAAASQVAGAAALLIAIDPSLTNGVVIGRLARTANPAGTSEQTGNGRLNLGRAVSDTSTDPVVPVGAPGGGPLVGPYVAAATCTWTGGTSAWATATNWSCGHIPTSADDVVIGDFTPGSQPTLGASTTVNSLTINGRSATTGHRGGCLTISTGVTLTVTGNLAITGSTAGTNSTTCVGAAGTGIDATSGTGSITVGGSVTLTNASAGPENPVIGMGSGTLTIAGNLTTGSSSRFTYGTSTVVLNGTGTQTISGTAKSFYNLTVNKASGSATLGVSETVYGNLTVTSGTLDLATFTANRIAAGGILSVAAGATLRIGGTQTFPTNYSTNTFNATSTVEYYGGAQTVASQTYGNLTITTAGTKTAGGAVTVAGNFLINSGATFAASTYTHNFQGNFTNSGTFTANTSTANFNGSAASVIGGSTATTFNNLTINNAAGVSLSGVNATVSGTLTLTSGAVTTGAQTLIANGTVNRTNGFVIGNLQKPVTAGTAALTFEVGTAGSYTPIALTSMSVATATGASLTATVTASDHPQIATSGLDPTQDANRYWTLTPGGTLTVTTYIATVIFVSGDVDSGADPTSFVMRKYSSSWAAVSSQGSATATSNTATLSSTPGFGNFAVGTRSTTTSVASSLNPSVFGQSVTFTATVTALLSGAGTPTGSVQFQDGGSNLGSAIALNGSGVATYATSALTVGSHTITAVFTDASNFATSTGTLSGGQAVNAASTATTITTNLTTATVVGQPYPVAFTVASVAPGAGTPTGNVTVSDGTANCTATVAAGSCSLTSTSAGAKTITATYAGDGNFNGSASSGTAHTVNAASTTTTIGSSANPSVFGQSVTFTATVTALLSGAGTPTGSVQFQDGGSNLGSAIALNGSGVATYATSALTVGSHTITAVFTDASNFATSTGTLSGGQAVKKAVLSVNAVATGKTYGGTEPAFTWTYSGFAGSDNAGNSGITGTAVCTRTAGETVAGSPYTITCAPDILAAPNYSFATGTTAAFTIGQATLVVTPDPQALSYGDEVDPIYTFGVSGFQNGETVGTAAGYVAPVCTSSYTPTTSVAASPLTISCSGGSATDYAFDTSATAALTIGQAASTTVVTFEADPYVYRGTAFTATALATGAGSLSTSVSIVYSGDCTNVTVTDGCMATATFAGDVDHTGSSDSKSITITPKTLTVTGITAADKNYDGTTTATLNTTSAALVGVLGGDVVTLNKSGAIGTFDTKYPGTGKTVTVSGLTIGGADAGNYTLTQPTTTATIIGGTYVPLNPTRILDTRYGTGGLSGPFHSHVARTFQVTGAGGVPVGATAVTGNLTVTLQAYGYLFIGPIAMNNPTSSTLNFPANDNRANAVTVALGSGGAGGVLGSLSITYVGLSSTDTAHAIFDVTGYFVPNMSGATYVPLNPTRILDTRDGTGGLSGPFHSHVARTFLVTGNGGVPSNATAVTGNLTVTLQAYGYLFIGPIAMNYPTSSNLNFPAHEDRANAVTVALGSGGGGGGTFSITYVGLSSTDTAHVVFDVTGYFVPDMSGAIYVPLTPTRILDSRDGTGGLSGPLHSHVARTFQVTGHGGVPSGATAVTGNLTATLQAYGYLFIGPIAMNDPTSSNLNFPANQDRANAVTVALGSGGGGVALGTLSITYVGLSSTDTAHVVFDVTGYFVP